MPTCLPKLNSFFHRFLFDFYSELGPPKPQKSLKFRLFYNSFLFFTLFKIRSILNPILVPTWLHFPSQNPPKSTKILPKTDPKMHQIFDRFLHRFFFHFGSILGPKLGPCWPNFRSKWGGPVGGRPPFCWVCVTFRFLGRPGPLLAQFGLDFGGFGPPFWRFLGSILEVSGGMWLVILVLF